MIYWPDFLTFSYIYDYIEYKLCIYRYMLRIATYRQDYPRTYLRWSWYIQVWPSMFGARVYKAVALRKWLMWKNEEELDFAYMYLHVQLDTNVKGNKFIYCHVSTETEVAKDENVEDQKLACQLSPVWPV